MGAPRRYARPLPSGQFLNNVRAPGLVLPGPGHKGGSEAPTPSGHSQGERRFGPTFCPVRVPVATKLGNLGEGVASPERIPPKTLLMEIYSHRGSPEIPQNLRDGRSRQHLSWRSPILLWGLEASGQVPPAHLRSCLDTVQVCLGEGVRGRNPSVRLRTFLEQRSCEEPGAGVRSGL